MPTLELLPDDDSIDEFIPSSLGSDNYLMVDEASHSDDTDFVYTFLTGKQDLYDW